MRKKRCGFCGRVVAMPRISSQKRRVRHKCPHGKWCVGGLGVLGNDGMNHSLCPNCRHEALGKLNKRAP